ncbi:MAG: GHMP family kinase ATP-binding protein [Candidatus Xenobia bacterium]
MLPRSLAAELAAESQNLQDSTMVISRTPFRVSFFGGGTDYPAWFEEHGQGAVLSTTIDKFCYISVRSLPPFFDHRYCVVYSRIERVVHCDEIEHPAVRECLKYTATGQGVEIHHDADLPARSGLGSSSAFTVGLLKALHAFHGRMIDTSELLLHSLSVEQDILQENVGCQDQAAAAYGGFNHIKFAGGRQIDVNPITLPARRLLDLNRHMMLFFTGLSRTASEVAMEQIQNIPGKQRDLREMAAMVPEALKILGQDHDLIDFGKLLHESWCIKRTLSSRISTDDIDEVYRVARDNGAIGGKLLGAGGGGFLLLFAHPEDQPRLRKALGGLLHVPFRFDTTGSRIIFYQSQSSLVS